eukprot:Em0008g1203a
MNLSPSEIARKEAELEAQNHELKMKLTTMRTIRIEVEERVLAQEERLHRLKIEKDKLKVQLNKLLHDMRKAQTSDHSASGGETLEVVSEGQESGSQPQNMHVEKIKVKSLEDKMECIKTEYLERVREHEGSISGMKPHLDQQPIPHSSAGGGAKCVQLSEEAMH